MVVFRIIDLVDDTGQGSAFSASCWPGHQYEPFCHLCDIDHCVRQMEGFKIRQIKLNDADHRPKGTSLFQYTGAESGNTADRKRKIVVSCFHDPLHIPVSRQLVDLLYDLIHLVRKYLILVAADDPAFDLAGKRTSWDQKDIRRILAHRCCQ